jgi:hypothetical protein
MDTLRGPFDGGASADDTPGWDAEAAGGDTGREEDSVREAPPAAIGQDERRMQVRAYNHWASLLGDATFPSIEALEPENLADFGPNSVLLDFSGGIDDPVVVYLGELLAAECGSTGAKIERLSDVPPRSLLSRITDHYMQILANQAPIGFEAEFVNERGASVLYRGILLPFSSDDQTIDFIYGVINWKEMADAGAADELLLAIDQAIDESGVGEAAMAEDQPQRHHVHPVTDWADSPGREEDGVMDLGPFSQAADPQDADQSEVAGDNVTPFGHRFGGQRSGDDLPLPDFGQYALDDPEYDEFGDEIEEEEDSSSGYTFASLADYIEAPAKKAVDLDADRFDPEDYRVEDFTAQPTSQPRPAPVASLGEPGMDEGEATGEAEADAEADADTFEAPAIDPAAGLHDCLASARLLAQQAAISEDRSRQALYFAVGRAYDFSLAAAQDPEGYHQLLEESGLSVQERAPMTPIVKLVFGHGYDKTRLTEYAAVLAHAHRLELERGSLADFLAGAEGGLKGVVAAERRLRREEAGEEVEEEGEVRAALAKKLRALEALMLDAISAEGPEFSLVMVRRDGSGQVSLIGEIGDDVALIERAGKKLVG